MPRHADRHQDRGLRDGALEDRPRDDCHGPSSDPGHLRASTLRCVQKHLDAFFDCRIAFGSERDEVVFSPKTADFPFIQADPYLHEVLVASCEEALKHRARAVETLQTRVENAATPLLPRGKARAGDVARSLGLSQRTLSRRLAAEGLTFASTLDELRADLARHYLKDIGLSVSEIAWLLGFQDVSAFTRAFKRWNGSAAEPCSVAPARSAVAS